MFNSFFGKISELKKQNELLEQELIEKAEWFRSEKDRVRFLAMKELEVQEKELEMMKLYKEKMDEANKAIIENKVLKARIEYQETMYERFKEFLALSVCQNDKE